MRLVEEAKRVAPELAAAAAEGDELRRLPDSSWKLLQEGGFLRALQPARFGGGEVTLLEFVDAVVELATASPSAGWVAGVIGVHPWQLALFPDEAQQEMWGGGPDADALVVVQPHRQGGAGRRRLPGVGALVVLVGLRPLPGREPRRHRP